MLKDSFPIIQKLAVTARYTAEYFHQDHPDPAGTGQALGNTRLVFSDFNLNGVVVLGEDDPAIGRFTGVDPIAEEFPWVSTYNYAENEPVANIGLHGLQKVRYSVIAEKIVGNDDRGIIRTATPQMRERNSFEAGLGLID